MRRLLLLSNSSNFGQKYLEHAEVDIRAFFGTEVKTILFVPFALKDHAVYAAIVRDHLTQMGYEVVSLHEAQDPIAAVDQAEAMFIGGGNTFRLLKALYDLNLLEVIRARVANGMPYMGSSAGTNLATVSIRTTNDMPIVYPPSFDALNLVPFNINPHYLDASSESKHMGETREQRIKEFLEENIRVVVGLREGAFLHVKGDRMTLLGHTARIFSPDGSVQEEEKGADLSWILSM